MNGDAVPVAPGAVPVIGHILRLLHDPLQWLDECRLVGPLVRVHLGGRRTYLACSADLVHDMLVGQAASFDKGGPLMDRAREVVGNGLGTSCRDDHRRQRRLMQPAFTPPRIRAHATVMREEAAAMAESWRPNGGIDLLDDLTTTAMRVLIRTLLPTADLREVDWLTDQVRPLLGGIFLRATVPFELVHRLPTAGNRRFNRARAELSAAADRGVAAARAEPSTSGLLGAMAEAGADEANGGFSDRDLRDQMMTLLIAGTETAATTVAWLVHLLTLHPYVEGRLYAEIDSTLAGRVADADDLDLLPYTRNVLMETMRIYPVAWLLTRVSVAEVDFAGHHFEAGTDFLFSPYQLHHDAAFFSEPDTFDPDRWAEPLSGPGRHAHLPFGAGRRTCIGAAYAMTEATIILSAIASRWHLRPATHNRVRPRARVALAPMGLRLVSEPRTVATMA